MIEVVSSTEGEQPRVRVVTYDGNDALADADAAPTITIEQGERSYGSVIVDAASMTNVGTGTYDYWWDTTDLDEDVYNIVVEYLMDTHKRKLEIRHRVRAES